MQNTSVTSYLIGLSFFGLLLLVGCQKTDPQQQVLSNSPIPAVLLGTEEAAQAIVSNDDGFFDDIKKLDMGIQLGEKVEAETKSSLMPRYLAGLQSSCLDFSDVEKEKVVAAWQRASTYAQAVFPALEFPKAQLAKISGALYGDRVYFTRGQTVFLPEHEIRTAKDDDLVKTLLHELFHIMSRTKKDWQENLYNSIGFSVVKAPDTLLLPFYLGERVLLNPDGVTKVIYTTSSGKEALPLVVSGPADYKRSRGGYFDHLTYGYYPVRREATLITTAVNDSGVTGPDRAVIQELRERIAFSTEYLLHPDEILADNFADLIIWKNGLVGDPPPDQQAYFAGLFSLMGRY